MIVDQGIRSGVNGKKYLYQVDMDDERLNHMMVRATHAQKKTCKRGPVQVKLTDLKSRNIQRFGATQTIKVCTIMETQYFITNHFKQSYDILAGEGYGNQNAKFFEIDKLGPVDYNALSRWKVTGDGSFLLKDLLQEMVYDGVILPGKYLISIG